MNNELYHYGVIGMKWGVRKDRSSSSLGSKFKAKIKKKKISIQRKQAASKARKAKARKAEILKDPVKLNKHKNEFSDAEIEQALKRFRLEQELSKMSVAKIQRGADYIKTFANYTTQINRLATTGNALVKLTTGENLFKGAPNSNDKDQKK